MAFDKINDVMPPFFLVRIPKEAQRARMEKIGVLYYPPEYVYMKRGMQCAEILLIGRDARIHFPEAKVGDILITHHFIEGKTSGARDKYFLIHEDDEWNYYCVTAFCYNGDRNNTFGVYDPKTEKITPSKDYVFFEIDETPVSDLPPFMLEQKGMPKIITNMAFEYAGAGLVTPKARKKTRQELINKQAEVKKEMDKLSRWVNIAPEKAVPMLKSREKEAAALSKEINTFKYEPHILSAFNDELLKTVHPSLKKGDKVYVLNIATYMQIEFLGTEYIISESKYVCMKSPNKARALSLS